MRKVLIAPRTVSILEKVGFGNLCIFCTGSILALAACVPTPKPAIEVRVVEKIVPVAVSCVKASDLPTEPPLIGSKLTGDAARDLPTVAASAVRLRAWGRTLGALVSACVLPD